MKKVQLGFMRLTAAVIAVFAAGATALSASAATLYTNTWSNTAGVNVLKNWGDAANWSVAYEPGVTPPASAVPTGESRVSIPRSASVSLQPAGNYSAGLTYFLAGTTWQTLNLEIPTGSRLSLDGMGNTTHLGSRNWQSGSINNKVKIDVNGGELVFGQSVLSMRPNMEDYISTGYNWIQIRNGGTMSVTNGYVRLYGGSSSDSQGRGGYTNIIDVLEGSTLNLSGSGRIAFGSSHNGNASDYDAPWTQNYFGGGWVNVKGGKILVRDSTTSFPIVMNGDANAGMGDYLNVSDGGMIDLGGKSLYIGSRMRTAPAAISVSSGGVITNGNFSVQDGLNTYKTTFCIDVNNGKIILDQFTFGGASGLTHGRPTVRVHGGDSFFVFNGWGLGTYGSNKPIFADLRLKAHTDRNADFAIRPIRTCKPIYESGGSYTHTVPGYWRLSPDGGFQLVHKSSFELLCRKHDSQGDYTFTSTYGGLIGDEMWATNCEWWASARWERYMGYQYAYVFRVSLKDDAKLTDGVALAQPKPRAWLQLPSFTARQIDTIHAERVSVRLDLAAPEGGSLDLDGVVAKMRSEGGQDAYADDSVAGYNVRVDLPMDELAAGVANDKIVMDFVSCELYPQAAGITPMTTNALIRAATCETLQKGMVLIFF